MAKMNLFIWIPKTAGTSLVKSLGLERVEKKRLTEMPEKFTFPHYEPKVALDHFFPQHDEKEFFKFTIVRNPFDRAVSLWLRMRKKDPKLTFDEYADTLPYIKKIGLYKSEGRFNGRSGWSGNSPQVRWLENVKVDYIGKHEELPKVYQDLRKMIGGEEELIFTNATKGKKHYRTYYNESIRRKLEDYYKEDLEAFNYKF